MTSPPPDSTNVAVSANLLGAANALFGIALAVFLARGITDFASAEITVGLWTVAGVLAARWLLGVVLFEWGLLASTQVRQEWRQRLIGHFLVPRREGERGRGDLALSIERVADAPTLQLLGASARVSVLGVVVIFWSAGWLPGAITIVLLSAAIPLYRRAGARSARLNAQYHERRALLESRQLELLHHAPELRALGAVDYGADEIGAISDSEHVIALRAIRVALESSLVTEFLSGVSVGLVAMVVGFGLLNGRLGLDRALIAVLVTSELFVHIRRYGTEFHRREDAVHSRTRLGESTTETALTTSTSLLSSESLVTQASPDVVDLDVVPGARVLVSGPSGSGKTTLLHTLLGWRRASAGEVRRGDSGIGYVSVESPLLSGTLWDNLTLGEDIDTTVVRYQLNELGLVGSRFEDLDVELLADGRGLSEGERVRLILARCLLANVGLLLLDDIAGVLDEDSRERVRATLDVHPRVAIIETTVDTPLLVSASTRITVGS